MAKIKSKFSDEELEQIQDQINDKSGLYEYRTKDYPFEVIVTKFGDENDLNATLYVPNYQREFVWDRKKQSRFIESVLLKVPLTPFLASENEGRLEIIDGSQRIRTLLAFYNNDFAIRGLDKLKMLNRAKYKDLPKKAQKDFYNRDFKVIIVDEANSDIKQDIFNRINTSSEQLTDSEVRKGSYAGDFYNLILKLKNDEKFRDICPVSAVKESRGEYEELILRFFAYIDKYKEFKHDVADFLDDYLEDMNEVDFDETIYLSAFNNMVDFISKYFPIGFRKDIASNSTPRVRFEAISVGVYLALQEDRNLQNPNMKWLESEGFKIQTTSDSSNNPGRLQGRIEFVRDGLLGRLTENELSINE